MTGKLKVIESYVIGDQKRYKIKIVGTNLVINVAASDENEAIENARKLIDKLKIKFKDF